MSAARRRKPGAAAGYTVFGAGSVGTVLAGLLAHAGLPVCIAGRDATRWVRLEGDLDTIETGCR